MKRLLFCIAIACTAGCTFPQETKMQAVEPTDSQMHTGDQPAPAKRTVEPTQNATR
jgi:hypothetical protein